MNILITTALGVDKANYIADLRSKFPNSTIVGVDMNATDNPTYVPEGLDYLFPVPRGTDPKYLDSIQELVDLYAIDVLIPCSDPETTTILDKGNFNIPVIGTHSSNKLEDIYNKSKCIDILSRHCKVLALPHTEFMDSDLYQLIEFTHNYSTFVVKPNASYGSRGLMIVNRKCNDWDQINQKGNTHNYSLKAAQLILEQSSFHDRRNMILQEYWSGPSLNVECAVYDGKLYACVPHLRTGYRWGRLDEGTLTYDPMIEEVAQEIIDALGMSHGLFNFEANYTDESKSRIGLVEVNPRVSAVHSQCKLLGYDIIQAGLDIAAGRAPNKFLGSEVRSMVEYNHPMYYITESETGGESNDKHIVER